MCGIAGIWKEDTSSDTLQEIVVRMQNSLLHRGPDDQGLYIAPPPLSVGLGHRRLSIIDPEGGHQPMSNEDGSLWIVFNGAIYNHLDLMKDLLSRGHIFKSRSDTEVILHAYEQYGPACNDRLNGMFAYAILDLRQHQLFLTRDRVGIKPLYYFHKPGTFAFASEIKALLATKEIRPTLNPSALHEYVVFQHALGNHTLFQNVHKLPPGHTLTISSPFQSPQPKRFWSINFQYDFTHDETWFIERLRSLLEDSIRLQLRSDVPLGAHLSGGIDSSVTTCLAARNIRDPLHTFSGFFPQHPEFNESHFSQLVSRHANTIHHDIPISAADFYPTLEKMIFHMDEPAAGPGLIPQYHVSRQARQFVKVVLGGQGGDEIFFGYARYLMGYLEECLRGAIWETADIHKHAAVLKNLAPSLSLLQNYKGYLQYFWEKGLFDSPDKRYMRLTDRRENTPPLISDELLPNDDRILETFSSIFNEPGAASLMDRMFYFDLTTSLPALLHVEDRTSMAVSLESRVPLLDHRIIEFMATVPTRIKFKNGQMKYLFKQAIRGIIPDDVLDRKDKMGFPVPLSCWTQKELKSLTRDLLTGPQARSRGIYRMENMETLLEKDPIPTRPLWGMICLETWLRTFKPSLP